MRGLAQKLGIKSGYNINLIGSTPSEASIIRDSSPEGVTFLEEPSFSILDMIIFWPKTKSQMTTEFFHLQDLIKPDGAIWVVIPKKKYASRAGINFSWDELQTAALQTDLVDNKIASINEQSYATRFVICKDRRNTYRK